MRPPAIARWLLIHFGCSPNNLSVVGDLDERYYQHRSNLWYRKQVLAALIVGFFQAIGRHKLLALRAVTVGLFVLDLLANIIFDLFGRVIAGTLPNTVNTQGQLPLWTYVAFGATVCLTGVLSG